MTSKLDAEMHLSFAILRSLTIPLHYRKRFIFLFTEEADRDVLYAKSFSQRLNAYFMFCRNDK